MDNVRLPIKTSREGNKITKVCVEDIYKMINRIGAAEERSAEKWNEIWESIDKEVEDADGGIVNGCLVIGTGISQPNIKDAFDEAVGNNIAFMKAKLNANFKKRNIVVCAIFALAALFILLIVSSLPITLKSLYS